MAFQAQCIENFRIPVSEINGFTTERLLDEQRQLQFVITEKFHESGTH